MTRGSSIGQVWKVLLTERMRIGGRIFSAQWVRCPRAHRCCGLPCYFFFITHLSLLLGWGLLYVLSFCLWSPAQCWAGNAPAFPELSPNFWNPLYNNLLEHFDRELIHSLGSLLHDFLLLLTRISSLLLTMDHPVVWAPILAWPHSCMTLSLKFSDFTWLIKFKFKFK